MLSGECTLVVEEEERPLRQWDYFHCPAYPVSEVAAKYDASVAKETDDPDEAYADWPGECRPVRLPWPPESDAKL